MSNLDTRPIEGLTIDTIRALAMDAVQKANSGHPGTPMALAPVAYALYRHVMNHNPQNPHWFDRDRFILSCGHASMLLYAILHLSGYKVSLEDLKQFRQLDSNTPGHPEFDETDGVETTTGPLGQGLMNAVGMAIAEAHLAAKFNQQDHEIIDHYIYTMVSDGDLMEGASHEAAAIAGHFGLGKLVAIYDDNHISIEGQTELAYSDDVVSRFNGYHWHVQDLGEKANDLKAIMEAIEKAKQVTDKPSLIIIRSHIAFGAPNAQDTSEAHGAPLGEDEVRATKKVYGLPEDETFFVHERVYEHMNEIEKQGKRKENEWNEKFSSYEKAYPELAAQLKQGIELKLTPDWKEAIPQFKSEDKPIATRSAGGKVINAIADKVPYLIGGSADLSPSTKTLLNASDYFAKGAYENRNIPWGVRELGMCGAVNGIALHGGLRPFAATFFVFSDYARPAMRLAAIMKLPVIYVMTHDSIGVGEDGPTHQPVEQVAAFRCMPNMTVIRPADANETSIAWQAAMMHKEGPTVLVLTRQNLPILDRSQYSSAEGVFKGAYVLSKEQGEQPAMILMSSGSEVELVLKAQQTLFDQGIDTRVVSMPSWELFEQQSPEYRASVLPQNVTKRLAVEALSPFGWEKYTGPSGKVIGMDSFGASGPYAEVYEKFCITVDHIVKTAQSL